MGTVTIKYTHAWYNITHATTTKVHVNTKTIGHGPLYQGRYKSFLVDTDTYLLTLIKYVERNPVRARLTPTCEAWQWGSAHRRIHGEKNTHKILSDIPVELPNDYRRWINTPDTISELDSIRQSVNKGMPYGRDAWADAMVKRYKLETTMRSAGRPKDKN
jgi:putative transposase